MVPITWLIERLSADDIWALATGGRDACESGAGDDIPAWPSIAGAIAPGDEVWRYCSPLPSWEAGRGRRGLAVVRGGAVVAAGVTYASRGAEGGDAEPSAGPDPALKSGPGR